MGYYGGYPGIPGVPYGGIQMPQAQQNAGMQSGIIWVQGEAAAKSYLIAPNSTVPLWDSEDKVIYLKSADPSGLPSMKVLEYKIRGEEEAKPAPEYVTKADFDALAEKVKELSRKKPARVIREEDEDE